MMERIRLKTEDKKFPEIDLRIDKTEAYMSIEGKINGDQLQLVIASTEALEHINSLITQVNSLNGKNHARVVPFYGELVVISANGAFEIFDQPKPSTSLQHGSQSMYFGQTRNRELIIQGQPPNSASSEHEHDGPEEYHHVGGILSVRTPQQEYELSLGSPHLHIPEGVKHQVLTRSTKPAISVIVCKFTRHTYSQPHLPS